LPSARTTSAASRLSTVSPKRARQVADSAAEREPADPRRGQKRPEGVAISERDGRMVDVGPGGRPRRRERCGAQGRRSCWRIIDRSMTSALSETPRAGGVVGRPPRNGDPRRPWVRAKRTQGDHVGGVATLGDRVRILVDHWRCRRPGRRRIPGRWRRSARRAARLRVSAYGAVLAVVRLGDGGHGVPLGGVGVAVVTHVRKRGRSPSVSGRGGPSGTRQNAAGGEGRASHRCSSANAALLDRQRGGGMQPLDPPHPCRRRPPACGSLRAATRGSSWAYPATTAASRLARGGVALGRRDP